MNSIDTMDLSGVITRVEDASDAVPRELLTLIPDTKDEYLLVIDNSAVEMWMMCPTKAKYYMFCGREGYARNAALVFGGTIHEGLEVLLKGKKVKRIELSDEPFELETEEEFGARIVAAMVKFWTENPAPTDVYRTLENAVQVIQSYRIRATLPDYEATTLSDQYGPLIERPFELPLGVLDVDCDIQLPYWETPRRVRKIHVAWSGRIDLVAHTYGRNRVVDHKTTSIAGDSFSLDFVIGNQSQGYVWAAQQMWPDLNIDGFCVNAIFLKKPAAGCSITEPGPRGGKPALDFFRTYYQYTPERLKEWEFNALTMIEDFVHCIVRDYFPMHTKQCFNKYGRCVYHDVCTIDDPRVRESFLMSDTFRRVTWNPTTGR